MRSKLCGILLVLLAAGCASTGFPAATPADTRLVPPDDIIELGLDRSMKIVDIECHISPRELPDQIRSAADAHVGAGDIVAAEKEYQGGKLRWEITKMIDGKEWEVLFDPQGNPTSWEVQIDPGEAPEGVLKVTEDKVGGSITSVEKILDDAKNLTAYHVKRDADGYHYKLIVSPEGRLRMTLRETKAEIEVPLD